MKRIVIIAGLMILSAGMAVSMSQTGGKVHAPDFPGGAQWINSKPLKMADLRGKIVLLDFWTYACINCIHIIPDLKKLEQKYKNEMVVIGVHSAKFTTEKDSQNILAAVQRYGIKHPVINDNKLRMWYEYAVRAWPTVVLINPEGYISLVRSGEGVYEPLDKAIGEMVTEFSKKGELNTQPVNFELEDTVVSKSPLRFPGKIAIDDIGKRLFITDSNNNRVVILKTDGETIQTIGSGEQGFADGFFLAAKFNHPQGISYDRLTDIIYVADTENHAIRKIDLKGRMVETIAGNGVQARLFNIEGKGKEISLNSPWDLTLIGNILYIAMAGSHQVWSLDLQSNDARVYAGNGQEGIVDGPRLEAKLAQPSGITTDGKYLYIADSEASAVRRIGLGDNARVETIIGEGLFEFGDIDGKYPKARLQHPIGIAYEDSLMYVADTYNNKIKKVDPVKKEVKTYIGDGKRGALDGSADKAELNEPNGLAFDDGKIYITDTNNHLIRVFDIETNELSTLKITGLQIPTMAETDSFQGETKRYSEQEIVPVVDKLEIDIDLPRGMKFNDKAPFTLDVKSDNPDVIKIGSFNFSKARHITKIPITSKPGSADIEITLYFSYCNEGNEGLCYFKDLKLDLPVKVTDNGAQSLKLKYIVPEDIF